MIIRSIHDSSLVLLRLRLGNALQQLLLLRHARVQLRVLVRLRKLII